MEDFKYVVGVDIGTTKIVAIVAERDEFGKLKVLGVGKSKSTGVLRGVVSNVTRTVESIKRAVEEAEQLSGKNIGKAFVGIAGQHIKSFQHPEYITRQNPNELIGWGDIDELFLQVNKLLLKEGERIIEVLPQEFKIDGQSGIIDPIGMYGGRLEANFHLILGQNSAIKNISECIKMAGIDLQGMTLEPLASAEAVLTEEEKMAGVALVDIGGGTTDLAIFKDGIIRHTAVIPFGGNIITEDIKEGCSIIEQYAEKIKISYGSAWPGENKENEIISIPALKGREPKEIAKKSLSKIINARIVEIISSVFSEIKMYGYNDQKKKLIGGIVLTGGGSQLSHLKQLVEYITGLDTRIGHPNEHLSGDTIPDIASPLYATSVGLAMTAFQRKDKEDEKSSFIKEREALEKSVNQEEGELNEDMKSEIDETELENNNQEFRKSFFERYFDKVKNFLERVE